MDFGAGPLHRLEREQFLPRPRDEVFDFFSRAENLELLTPPWLGFKIVTPVPVTMQKGTLIDYRIRLLGLSMHWRSVIEVWEPNERFVDRQLQGPYASWVHLHTFEDAPGGVIVRDRVDYALPFGALGTLAHATFVRPRLETIFAFRRIVVAERFGAPTPHAGMPPTSRPDSPGSPVTVL